VSVAPAFSVVIPAHDEEHGIGRCLAALTDGALAGELEVVVVANGCHDATAEAARAAWPAATVVELTQASKIAALNAGDAVAQAFPRIYLDADIELSLRSARAVADALRAGPALCAAPAARFELGGRPWAIRAFYRVWQQLPYLQDGMVGSGVYGLSEAGRARFGAFPDLTADDQFVLELFSGDERRTVACDPFVVHTPSSLSGLYRMRRRVYRGNRELHRQAAQPATGRRRALVSLVARDPSLLPAVVVYAAVNQLAELAGRSQGDRGWERDDSARTQPAGGPGRIGYLVSRYPSVSHTFVLQEVQAMRRAGVPVDTFSVRAAEPADLLAARDQEEAASTWAIRPVAVRTVLAAHLLTAVTAPRAWSATLASAVRQGPPGVRARAWRVLYFAQAVLLWRECRRRGISHLHAHLANVAADLASITVALGRRAEPGRPWSWSFTMHGPTEFFDVGHYSLAAKVASAQLVIAISDFARSQLMAICDEADWAKITVVHMGADLRRWAGIATPPRESSTLRLLSVGRLDAVKGQAVLLEAVAIARREGLDCSLTLVGEGPARPTIERKLRQLDLTGVVDVAGAVGHDGLAAYYANADVFCMASFAEGIPVVLMEAMAAGLPVVATQVNGIPELVEDGATGLLVPPARPDLLARALHRLGDTSLRRSLARAGQERVERDFDADRCGAQVAALLQAIVAGR
jgi:glycosyltransferase involved in cell wall biosynthesis